MKIYHYIIYRIIRGILCFWSLYCYSVDSIPYDSSNPVPISYRRYFIDCGSVPPTVTSSKSTRSVASMIRRRDQDYTTAYACFRALKVEQMPRCNEGSMEVDGVIKFSVDKATLDKLTFAKLTLSLAFAADAGEEEYEQLRDLEVTAMVSGYNERLYFSIPRLEDDKEKDGTRKRSMIEYTAFEMLQKVAKHQDINAGDKAENPPSKLDISFYFNRKCDNFDLPYCPSIFDTKTHTPSLRLFYI